MANTKYGIIVLIVIIAMIVILMGCTSNSSNKPTHASAICNVAFENGHAYIILGSALDYETSFRVVVKEKNANGAVIDTHVVFTDNIAKNEIAQKEIFGVQKNNKNLEISQVAARAGSNEFYPTYYALSDDPPNTIRN